MRVTIGRNTEDAMRILGIPSYPFSAKILQSNFRRLIKLHHPDNGGKKEMAQQVISAYNHVKNLTIDVEGRREENIKQFEEEKEDLFSFWDICPNCKGLGKEWARGAGRFGIGCWKCHGSGRMKINPFNPVIAKGGIMI